MSRSRLSASVTTRNASGSSVFVCSDVDKVIIHDILTLSTSTECVKSDGMRSETRQYRLSTGRLNEHALQADTDRDGLPREEEVDATYCGSSPTESSLPKHLESSKEVVTLGAYRDLKFKIKWTPNEEHVFLRRRVGPGAPSSFEVDRANVCLVDPAELGEFQALSRFGTSEL